MHNLGRLLLGLLQEKLRTLSLQNNQLNGLIPSFFKRDEFKLIEVDLSGNPFWCPLPAWPTIITASCVHCPGDVFVDDKHRTCTDHGVCIDGLQCRCDPEWTGDNCEVLDCPNNCNEHGECINERVPRTCGLNGTDPTIGMCTSIDDTCVAAFHDCPSRGISSQVDSEGITIALEPDRHNQIVYARCVCLDEWAGNDCSIPPPPPPTEQPWPDPRQMASGAASALRARPSLLLLLGALICLAVHALLGDPARRAARDKRD